MSLPLRIIELATRLVNSKEKRIRQAALRKAVSAAYYALFDLLSLEYAAMFSADLGIQGGIIRTINHKDIAAVARDFIATPARFPRALGSVKLTVPPELVDVANAFLTLQEERHAADYDLTLKYSQREVVTLVQKAKDAFAKWEIAKTTPAARIFLACFQLKKTWDVER